MRLPNLTREEVAGKAVIVRIDAELDGNVTGSRMQGIEEMARWLIESRAGRIKMIGHSGEGLVGQRLAAWWGDRIEINEDLRADPREEENSQAMAAELAEGFEVYINNAFSVAHREHTSVIALPIYMKQQGKKVFAGLRLMKEIEMLTKVLSTTPLPPPNLGGGIKGGGISKMTRLLIVGGAKASDKAKSADILVVQGWKVVRGGMLPGVDLRPDRRDITDEAISAYKQQIAGAQIIVVAGPMGRYEEEDATKGTKEIFTAVTNALVYKVAGGGDTEAALAKFNLTDKFDWISVGGGAMLQFLAQGMLPGIEVLIS